MSGRLEELIRTLPKTELHLHLEGSVTPELLYELVQAQGSELAGLSLEELERQVYEFEDFYSFLQSYRVICMHLIGPEEHLRVLRELEAYLVRESIRYAELIYTPSIPWKFGRDGEETLDALLAESNRFERESGVTIRWILDSVRQFGVEVAQKTAELARRYAERGIVAVGLGGDERAIPVADFAGVFSWARAHGLFVHIHAGEIGPPEEIWAALKVLGANRIGHGIQAARDPALMEYLREHAIGLDVCLTSNVRTRAWPMLAEHPLPLLLKRGVPVSLATDDPGLFRTGLCGEIQKAVETFDLGEEDLSRMLLQGVRSSFLPYEQKMELMQTFGDELHSALGSPGPAGGDEDNR